MKVSEAIDQLKIGDTVWMKGKVEYIDKSGALPLYIEFSETTKYFAEADEISLTEPVSKKVEIPEYVGSWIDFCKERGISLHTAMNHHSELLRRIEKTYEEMYSWLTDEKYQEHEEIFARAWLDGFTVKPKRWVVKKGKDCVITSFTFFNEKSVNYDSNSYGKDYMYFTDHAKAEAVATLVEGSVEEADGWS